MLIALFWGLIQGLTEFLPISSSGHLVLVPELLGLEGPDLATSAVLHLGTLLAVLAYYRTDLMAMLRPRRHPQAGRLIALIALGTVPAAIAGLLLEDPISALFESPALTALALVGTGVILFGASLLPVGGRTTEEMSWADAILVGAAQALALIPGISRSGATISTGLARRAEPGEAARFSFLLAIPAIAGAGLYEALRLEDYGGLDMTVLAGLLAAAVSGYAAIAVLLRALGRFGIRPFAWYCLAVGSGAFVFLTWA